MKIRIFAVLLIAALLCCIASCQKKETVDLPDAQYTLEITEEYLKRNGNSLKLMYPTVSGYSDTASEETVNASAAALAREMYEQEGLIADSDGGYVYTALEAVVTLASADFYSVFIGGTIESEVSGGTDIFAYTLNCDLKNAVFLTTEEIVADYDALVRAFLGNDFEADFGTENLEANFTRKALIEQYKSEYGIYPDLYFREGGLGILVDTLPSLGGYAGLLADIRDVSGCLKTENPTVAALCGAD